MTLRKTIFFVIGMLMAKLALWAIERNQGEEG